ncbi:hypothetical protein [Streptomyces sp. NPDC007100]|uniref:hypothetical protein n=1 Tax=Streptomyces sp. NPDC007100 TaxID=3155602 RepID=UPI00340C9104
MSKSRNANLLAKKIRSQTLLTQSTASRLAKQLHTYTGSPIADAPDHKHRRLEAHAAHVLATAFQDRQLNGALLGVASARPDATHNLALRLEPEMADEVLHVLLPYFDEDYGGLRGLPGLRPLPAKRGIVLHDVSSSARMMVMREDGRPLSLPPARDGEIPQWSLSPHSATQDEQEEAEWWGRPNRRSADVPVRDLLFSRILRRPTLVNRAAAPHGLANCYTHHSGDLVIEWCCGDTVEAFCAALLAHDFIKNVPRHEACKLIPPHAARMGGYTVVLRRQPDCVLPYDLFGEREIAKRVHAGYTS